VTVIGWSKGPFLGSSKVGSVSLEQVRTSGAREAANRVLRSIPRDAVILVHFDIDVIRRADLPAAYFPHEDGLSLEQAGEIVETVLGDHRVRLVEVSEYAVLQDPDRQSAVKIADLLAGGLKHHDR
jgi:arginase family enzyme